MPLLPRALVLLAAAWLVPSPRAVCADTDLPDLGPAWFARILSPETRTQALREWFLASGESARETFAEGEGEGSPEYFAAMHRSIRVLRAPQPGLPEAWLVCWIHDYIGAREILVGPDPDAYPPAAPPRESDEGIAWRPGDPLAEAIGAFLTNDQGQALCGFGFLGKGAIADADGDGMLDWISLSRLLFRERPPQTAGDRAGERAADLVSIGPIHPDAPRSASWLINLGPGGPKRERLHRLGLREREGGGGLEIFLVTNQPDEGPVRGETVLRPTDPFQEMPGLLPLGSGDPGAMATSFAKREFGWNGVSLGWGSADADFDAVEPKRATLELPGPGFSAPPGIAALSPDEAALALVEHNRDDTHRARFDLVLEPPLPEAPDSGWVEVVVEPGWAESSREIWWLREDGAECWICRPMERNAHFAVSAVAREPLAHWISILAHLERVRSVPRRVGFDRLEHDRFGGDDHTIVTVRAAIVGPSARLVEFEPGIPSLWNAVRGPVDRPLAGVLAAVLGNAPPGWDPSGTFERRNVLTEAETWLEPDRIAEVPPPLARHAIRLVGLHGVGALRIKLETLIAHWGPPQSEEAALIEARLERRRAELRKWSPPYDFSDEAERGWRLAIARARELESRQSSSTPSQLRETVLRSLSMLDSRDDPKLLEIWAGESGDPDADWARQRLAELTESALR